jgi:glycosyltransferase involved in cell wall biosynthesis
MRVSFVMASASRSSYGMFPAVVGTTRALARAGLKPCVLATRDEYTDQDRPVWGDVPVKAFRSVGPRKLFFAPAAPWWLARHAVVDLMAIQGVWASLFDAAVAHARRHRVPVVLTPHGMLEPWALRNSRWRKQVAEWVYVNRMLRSVDCFHVNSVSEASSIRQLGFRTPIAVIPHGIEIPHLVGNRLPHDEERTLLFLSRLHVKKGIRELVEAWNTLSSAAPNWRLVIAGPDEQGLLSGLRRTARDTKIDFVGPVFGDEKRRLLESADALVLPSYSEGFPFSVLEAWSYGLPVVKTRACNIPEGFDAGAAIEVSPNVDSLHEGLLRLFAMSQAQLSAMGRNGKELVRSRYSWDRVAQELASVYGWLLRGGAAPGVVQLV